MREAIKAMAEAIKKSIINDLDDVYSEEGHKVLNMVLNAYNEYQESERDGVDYIFDINKTDDLHSCIAGGMTAKEICKLYSGSQTTHLPYFYFGCNHSTPQPINTWEELRSNLIGWLDEMLLDIIAFPYDYEGYKTIYKYYITSTIIF